ARSTRCPDSPCSPFAPASWLVVSERIVGLPPAGAVAQRSRRSPPARPCLSRAEKAEHGLDDPPFGAHCYLIDREPSQKVFPVISLGKNASGVRVAHRR